jgi:phytoene dehydrogenase-like protein
MNDTYDFIIIGGGASGLAISCLLNKEKFKTLILESHSLLGGSASYFYRSQYCFDVGATTFSGLRTNGPLKSFLEKINLELPFIKIDPGMIIRFQNKEIRHFSSQSKYLSELIKCFPHVSPLVLEKYIQSNTEIENKAYEAISRNFLPKRSLLNLVELAKLDNLIYSRNR